MFTLGREYFTELLSILTAGLSKKCPARVYAFGDRVKGKKLRKWAEINLALRAPNNVCLPPEILYNLQDAFVACGMPYPVRIVDLNAVSPALRSKIEKEMVEISYI